MGGGVEVRHDFGTIRHIFLDPWALALLVSTDLHHILHHIPIVLAAVVGQYLTP
jgi:hypothetical protein